MVHKKNAQDVAIMDPLDRYSNRLCIQISSYLKYKFKSNTALKLNAASEKSEMDNTRNEKIKPVL